MDPMTGVAVDFQDHVSDDIVLMCTQIQKRCCTMLSGTTHVARWGTTIASESFVMNRFMRRASAPSWRLIVRGLEARTNIPGFPGFFLHRGCPLVSCKVILLRVVSARGSYAEDDCSVRSSRSVRSSHSLFAFIFLLPHESLNGQKLVNHTNIVTAPCRGHGSAYCLL